MKHANVAIFVPHNGCPHQCSFCDQRAITGLRKQPTVEDVRDTINIAKKSLKGNSQNAEIAFFGGSFTAIDRDYMISLLDVAYESVKNGEFSGIRISTRPDAITDEILQILKSRGVKSIELGAQSMDDEVLKANNRGHFKSDVIKASMLIKKYSFSLGLQMMTGLYRSSVEKDYKTAEEIAELKPDTVRIYPTIIMKDTYLSELYLKGLYNTYTLDKTIELCSKLLSFFEKKKITVIRLGLHDTDTMKNNMLAGPWHPALRELCESRMIFDRVKTQIGKSDTNSKEIIISVNPKTVSKLIGQKRKNIVMLENMGYRVKINQDKLIKINDFKIEHCR